MGNSSSSYSGDRNSSNDGGISGGGSGAGVGISNANEGQGQRRPGLASRGLSHRITGGGSNNNAPGGGGRSHSLPHLNLPSHLPSPFRNGGSLGLSRAELDERCKPSGLYPTCEWEPKQIRRLIANGQLAARLRGSDSRLTKTDRECPICFMYYSQSNVSKCCNATLCTECYLQIKPGKDRYCICPFCNNPKMVVSIAKGMDEGDVARREEEEQRVIEATIRNRISQLSGEGGQSGSETDGSFGSSLENYNRTRTFSNASNASAISGSSSDHQGGNPAVPKANNVDSESSALLSLAMTPEDRRALETEMRAQLSHETHRRMESEAEEARMRHAQEWYGSQAGSRARMREARLAELTGLLERMSARGVGNTSNNNNDGDEGDSSLMAGGTDGLGGLREGAGARSLGGGGAGSLTRLLHAMENSSGVRGGGGGGASLEDLMRFEAALFLGMDGGGMRGSTRNGRNSNNDSENEDNENDAEGLEGGLDYHRLGRPPPFGLGSSARSGRGRVVRRFGGSRGVSSTHLDTAELLMRGVSEEEQLAMAIAMSMQDSQQQRQQEQEEGRGGEQHQQAEETNGARSSGGGQQSNHRIVEAEEDDDSSSGSSSSSSSDIHYDASEQRAGNSTVATTRSRGEDEANTNRNQVRNGNDDVSEGVSLDEDEEAVIFAEV